MSRLPTKYRVRTRLNQWEAVQAVAEAANIEYNVFELTQTCADLGTPATVELPRTGTSMWHGHSRRDVSGTQSIVGARKGDPWYDFQAAITIEADGLSWETSIDLMKLSMWFTPLALEALIDRLLGYKAESSELLHLQELLEQERIKRLALEDELTERREKPLEPRERASLERLVYVLAIEAGYRLIKPHADEQNIIEAAARHCAKVPAGKGTIAKFLEAAKSRADSDRKS